MHAEVMQAEPENTTGTHGTQNPQLANRCASRRIADRPQHAQHANKSECTYALQQHRRRRRLPAAHACKAAPASHIDRVKEQPLPVTGLVHVKVALVHLVHRQTGAGRSPEKPHALLKRPDARGATRITGAVWPTDHFRTGTRRLRCPLRCFSIV